MRLAFPCWNMCFGQIARAYRRQLHDIGVAMQSQGHAFLVSRGIKLPDAQQIMARQSRQLTTQALPYWLE